MRSTHEFEVPVDVSFVPFSPSEHILGTGLDITFVGSPVLESVSYVFGATLGSLVHFSLKVGLCGV